VGERSFEDIRPHIERVLSAASGSSTPHRCTSVGLATGGSTLCTRRRALLTGLSMAGLQESVISPNAERWSSRTQIWPPSSSHPTRKSDHFELRSRAPTGRPTASIPVALPFGFCTVLGRRRSAEVYRHGRASPRFVGMRRRSSSAQFTATRDQHASHIHPRRSAVARVVARQQTHPVRVRPQQWTYVTESNASGHITAIASRRRQQDADRLVAGWPVYYLRGGFDHRH
jgi:hypothetical protein